MAHHDHVQVLVQGVPGEGPGGIRAGGEHVGVFDDGDDVRGVAAAGAFGVVGVDGPVFEGRDGRLDEAGFVEGVGVDEALDVVFVADAGGEC